MKSTHGASILALLFGVACSTAPGASGNENENHGGSGGSGGSVAAAGGSSGGSDSTAAGTGGTIAGGGGTGGTDAAGTGGSSGGTAGSGGGSSDAELASDFDGFRIEVPCNGVMFDPQPWVCGVDPELDAQSIDKTMGGDASTTYDVTLRLRGVVEPETYTGGTKTDRFYVGGMKDNGEWNIYSLVVTAPAQTYFFNAADDVGYTTATVDYEVTIPMQGGTALEFGVNGQNGHTIRNFDELVVPDIPPAPDAMDGQFLQFDVVSVVAQ